MIKTRQKLTSVQTKIWLIRTRQQSALYCRLSLNITREVCSYLPSISLLPSINENSLHLFNLETGSKVSFTLKHKLTHGTMCCFYRDKKLLFIGGFDPSKEVWSFHIDRGTLVPMQGMEFSRAWSGVAKFGNSVYVFGGNTNPALQSCEAMDVRTKQWRRLPSMHSPKVAFTPTVHNSEIYLACPMPTDNPVEVFNPVEKSFRTLPTSIVSNYYGSVSFFCMNALRLITYGRDLITLRLNSADKLTQGIAMKDPNAAVSNTPVIIHQEQVWWVNYINGKVVSFDLTTNLLHEFEFNSSLHEN